MFVQFRHFLNHLNVGSTFRKGIPPKDFGDLRYVLTLNGCTAEVDYGGKTFRLWKALLLYEREAKALLV